MCRDRARTRCDPQQAHLCSKSITFLSCLPLLDLHCAQLPFQPNCLLLVDAVVCFLPELAPQPNQMATSCNSLNTTLLCNVRRTLTSHCVATVSNHTHRHTHTHKHKDKYTHTHTRAPTRRTHARARRRAWIHRMTREFRQNARNIQTNRTHSLGQANPPPREFMAQDNKNTHARTHTHACARHVTRVHVCRSGAAPPGIPEPPPSKQREAPQAVVREAVLRHLP